MAIPPSPSSHPPPPIRRPLPRVDGLELPVVDVDFVDAWGDVEPRRIILRRGHQIIRSARAFGGCPEEPKRWLVLPFRGLGDLDEGHDAARGPCREEVVPPEVVRDRHLTHPRLREDPPEVVLDDPAVLLPDGLLAIDEALPEITAGVFLESHGVSRFVCFLHPLSLREPSL